MSVLLLLGEGHLFGWKWIYLVARPWSEMQPLFEYYSHGDRSLTTVYGRLSRMLVLRICSLYSSYCLKVSFVILPPSVVSPLPPHFLEEKSQDTITGLAQGLLTYGFLL